MNTFVRKPKPYCDPLLDLQTPEVDYNYWAAEYDVGSNFSNLHDTSMIDDFEKIIYEDYMPMYDPTIRWTDFYGVPQKYSMKPGSNPINFTMPNMKNSFKLLITPYREVVY